MPKSDRSRRRRGRLATAVVSSVLFGVVALSAPSSASALYEQHFCQYVYLTPTEICAASHRHNLHNVSGWVINTMDRICVATLTSQFGTRNSDWRCEYGFSQRIYYWNVAGVGVIRNGDPNAFYGYGIQEF